MATLRERRFWLTGLAATGGYVVFFFLVDLFGQTWDRYRDLEDAGRLLDTSRIWGDGVYWLVMVSSILLIGFGITWLYVRMQRRPGRDWRTALALGTIAGFVGSFLIVFNVAATFVGFSYAFAFWAGVEAWGGPIVAALVASLVYRDRAEVAIAADRLLATEPIAVGNGDRPREKDRVLVHH